MLANWLSESTSSTTTAAASTTGGGGPAENVLPFVRGGGGGGGGHGGSRRRGSSTASGGGEGERDSAAAAAASGSFDPDPSSVVEAHGHATQAEEYRREGHLLEALHEHLEASRCFLEAAEALQDVNSVTGAALILLSDGHARQAKTLQQILRKSDAATGEASSPSTTTAPLFKAGGARVVPPAVPKPGGLGGDGGGSMYSSAMIGSTASVTTAGQQERAWASQVDDMLALERALQAIGSQPLFPSGTFQATAGGGTERGGAGGGGVGGGGGGGNAAGRYLSSTLGDSFFLVNTRNAANREGVGGGGLTNASMVWEGGSMMSSKAGKVPSAAAAQGLRAPLRVGVGSPRGNSPLTMPQASFTGAGAGASHHASSSSSTTTTTPLSSSPRGGGNNTHTKPTTHTNTSTTSGGFLDGIESVQQGEVMRLLGCMKTLGDENAMLIKQVEEGTRVKQENERLRREVTEFKDLYNGKFKQLRAALEEFRTKYPHEANPTNHVSSSVDKARIKNLEAEVEQLFARLNREKEAGRKKDAMIRRYEQWYKTLKASAQSKGRSGGSGGGTGNNGGGTGGQQQQQQQQQQRMPSSSSSSSSGRGLGGASGGSNSNRPPPGR